MSLSVSDVTQLCPLSYFPRQIGSRWEFLLIPRLFIDLATTRKKLDNQEYLTAQKFYDDFKLMIRYCFLFNLSGTPMNLVGSELQRLFDEK